MGNRAERRAHKFRMREKAIRKYKEAGLSNFAEAVKTADYLASCSCQLCGNARKWFKVRTLKEEQFLSMPHFDE